MNQKKALANRRYKRHLNHRISQLTHKLNPISEPRFHERIWKACKAYFQRVGLAQPRVETVAIFESTLRLGGIEALESFVDQPRKEQP